MFLVALVVTFKKNSMKTNLYLGCFNLPSITQNFHDFYEFWFKKTTSSKQKPPYEHLCGNFGNQIKNNSKQKTHISSNAFSVYAKFKTLCRRRQIGVFVITPSTQSKSPTNGFNRFIKQKYKSSGVTKITSFIYENFSTFHTKSFRQQ